MNLQKLELGCGDRPTPGYLHQDVIALVELDFICQPYAIPLPENSLSEIIAIGVMEHLRFEDFLRTLNHVHKLLEPSGIFLFDVPDLRIWSKYLYDTLRGEYAPFSKQHIFATFWGWQRWEGDEHKSGWVYEDLSKRLREIGFDVKGGLDDIISRGITRRRFNREEDAHLYIKAIKK